MVGARCNVEPIEIHVTVKGNELRKSVVMTHVHGHWEMLSRLAPGMAAQPKITAEDIDHRLS